MVAQHKKGTDEIRVCIDPRDLNKALKHPHHQTKTVEEVAAKMDGVTILSVLDAKSQVHFGRYRLITSHLCLLAFPHHMAAFAFYACRMDFVRRQMFSSMLWKLCLKDFHAPLLWMTF